MSTKPISSIKIPRLQTVKAIGQSPTSDQFNLSEFNTQKVIDSLIEAVKDLRLRVQGLGG